MVCRRVAIVANMHKPLAILQGAEERLVNPAYIERLTIPSLWRGPVQVVAGAGHAAHATQIRARN
jgi:hypothetical protein